MDAFRAVPLGDDAGGAEGWRELVLGVFRGARFREEWYAAVELSGDLRARAWQRMDALPMYEEMITTAARWDVVDVRATHRLGDILEHEARAMKKAIARMSNVRLPNDPTTEPAMWKRRSAILCQVCVHRVARGLPAKGDRLGSPLLRVDRSARGRALRQSPYGALEARGAEERNVVGCSCSMSVAFLGKSSLSLSLSLAVACGSRASGAPADAGGEGGVNDADSDAGGGGTEAGDGGITFTMGAHVQAGADTYGCRYVSLPAQALHLFGASHTYTSGNHHLLVFRTDLDVVPGGGAERDCFTPTDDVMLHARAQLYAAQSKTGSLALPVGVALPLKASEVLLLQSHYLNAGSADVDASIMLHLDARADAPGQRAGTFFFAAPFIDVPAAQTAKAQLRCAFPSAVTLLSASAYAHSRAIDYAAFVDPASGPLGTAPFYRAPGFANPLPLQTSLATDAGAHVRMVCSYDNVRGGTELLAGPRNAADEECILSGIYYPALGDDVDACRAAPDMFGVGTAACKATRTCLDACPAASAPPADLGLGRSRASPIDPCWQRCVAASCSDASALLFALRACTLAKCASACSGGPSAACTSCVQSSCAAEAAACDRDTCP
jgi:hypothetical protein